MPALKFLFSTKGRVSRLPFILFVVGLRILIEAANIAARNQDPMNNIPQYSNMFAIVDVIGLIILWPVFAVTVKRLHDINLPAAPALGYFAPPVIRFAAIFMLVFLNETGTEPFYKAYEVLNWVMLAFHYYILALLLILSIVKGTKGSNRYGSDPKGKGGTAEAVF